MTAAVLDSRSWKKRIVVGVEGQRSKVSSLAWDHALRQQQSCSSQLILTRVHLDLVLKYKRLFSLHLSAFTHHLRVFIRVRCHFNPVKAADYFPKSKKNLY